jgi:hypothetical protein
MWAQHPEQWTIALNRASLVLAVRRNFVEKEGLFAREHTTYTPQPSHQTISRFSNPIGF